MGKGQLISKWFFGVIDFLQRTNKRIRLFTMTPQVDLFSFVFWRKLATPKTILKLTNLQQKVKLPTLMTLATRWGIFLYNKNIGSFQHSKLGVPCLCVMKWAWQLSNPSCCYNQSLYHVTNFSQRGFICEDSTKNSVIIPEAFLHIKKIFPIVQSFELSIWDSICIIKKM